MFSILYSLTYSHFYFFRVFFGFPIFPISIIIIILLLAHAEKEVGKEMRKILFNTKIFTVILFNFSLCYFNRLVNTFHYKKECCWCRFSDLIKKMKQKQNTNLQTPAKTPKMKNEPIRWFSSVFNLVENYKEVEKRNAELKTNRNMWTVFYFSFFFIL